MAPCKVQFDVRRRLSATIDYGRSRDSPSSCSTCVWQFDQKCEPAVTRKQEHEGCEMTRLTSVASIAFSRFSCSSLFISLMVMASSSLSACNCCRKQPTCVQYVHHLVGCDIKPQTKQGQLNLTTATFCSFASLSSSVKYSAFLLSWSAFKKTSCI